MPGYMPQFLACNAALTESTTVSKPPESRVL